MDVSLLREDEDESRELDWYVLESNAEHFKIQILFGPEDLISE